MFFHVSLQGVVFVDTGSLIGDGFRRVTDVWNAEIYVAALVVIQILGAVRQRERSAGVRSGASHRATDLIAVGVVLLVRTTLKRRVGGRSNVGLIERYGDNLVPAKIAHISDFDGQVAARLPLKVKRVVESVRQFVGAIVNTK
jgi:hypothetical protein